jgi:NIMA (never in mitosis gene a)-related kinase
MDYADGGDLGDYLKKQRAQHVLLPEKQVLDWFVQMCLAMKHIHDRKILHRDLKSQNVSNVFFCVHVCNAVLFFCKVFLTKEGVVKLGDFGIAKVLEHTMECAETAIGTPYYFSPEICNEKSYNHKSDVWALGCVLYEMLTLKHPFSGKGMRQLVMSILYKDATPPAGHYSPTMHSLVYSMLRKVRHT